MNVKATTFEFTNLLAIQITGIGGVTYEVHAILFRRASQNSLRNRLMTELIYCFPSHTHYVAFRPISPRATDFLPIQSALAARLTTFSAVLNSFENFSRPMHAVKRSAEKLCKCPIGGYCLGEINIRGLYAVLIDVYYDRSPNVSLSLLIPQRRDALLEDY
jgi:hypothetical protein